MQMCDAQEALDFHFIAYKVAEDHRVLLPVFICFDGFILSHTYEPVDIPLQRGLMPSFRNTTRIICWTPKILSVWMYATPDYYMEFSTRLTRQ